MVIVFWMMLGGCLSSCRSQNKAQKWSREGPTFKAPLVFFSGGTLVKPSQTNIKSGGFFVFLFNKAAEEAHQSKPKTVLAVCLAVCLFFLSQSEARWRARRLRLLLLLSGSVWQEAGARNGHSAGGEPVQEVHPVNGGPGVLVHMSPSVWLSTW